MSHILSQTPPTSKYKPWSLITYLAFSEKSKAVEFETYLKSDSGHVFAQKDYGDPFAQIEFCIHPCSVTILTTYLLYCNLSNKSVTLTENMISRIIHIATLSYDGEVYQSPSGAAKKIVGRACNGWRFWRYKHKGGERVSLKNLRR